MIQGNIDAEREREREREREMNSKKEGSLRVWILEWKFGK